MKELELAALWEEKPDEEEDWRAIWGKEERDDVPYPERKCQLRRLVLRAPKPMDLFGRLLHEEMLGPQLPELEQLYFGLENAVEIEEWEMSEEDDEGLLHPFTIDDDAEMTDASGDAAEVEVEVEEMSTEESGESGEETDETDVTSDDSSDSDGSGSGAEHVHEASMSGSEPGSSGDEWQTEDEIQVDGSDASAAEAMLGEEEVEVGRLPSYFEEGYKPPVRFATQLRDGVVLHRVAGVVAAACPGLKVFGWDGKGVVRVGPAWTGMSVQGRTELLEREVRRALEWR